MRTSADGNLYILRITQNNHEFLYFHCCPFKKESKEKLGGRKKFIRLGSNGKVFKKRHD